MSTGGKADKPEAMQLPRTLMERLGIAVGNPAVVYLRGVHAQFWPGVPPLPPWSPAPGMSGSPAPGAPGTWCPPGPPGPVPGPGGPGGAMMGTTVLNGILVFAGADYLALHVPLTGVSFREVLIPYNAIGMILPGGPVL